MTALFFSQKFANKKGHLTTAHLIYIFLSALNYSLISTKLYLNERYME
jgi:hypothetical protein